MSLIFSFVLVIPEKPETEQINYMDLLTAVTDRMKSFTDPSSAFCLSICGVLPGTLLQQLAKAGICHTLGNTSGPYVVGTE